MASQNSRGRDHPWLLILHPTIQVAATINAFELWDCVINWHFPLLTKEHWFIHLFLTHFSIPFQKEDRIVWCIANPKLVWYGIYSGIECVQLFAHSSRSSRFISNLLNINLCQDWQYYFIRLFQAFPIPFQFSNCVSIQFLSCPDFLAVFLC